MHRVLLIKPDRLSPNERWICQPLGIMHLASTARLAGWKVDILDLRIIPAKAIPPILDARLSKNPSIIGLSCPSWQIPMMAETARYIRKRAPGVLMVAGGPGPTYNTDECLENAPIDLCVLGEGEAAFSGLLERFETGADWTGIPGIAYRGENGGINFTKPAATDIPMDDLPDPAWDLLPFNVYENFLSLTLRKGKSADIMTSRGCPFRCIFCHSMFGKKFRPKSPQRVVEEMNYLYHRHGIRKFQIVDDVFNCDLTRAKTILEMIINRLPNISISCPVGLRGDIMDDEFISLCHRAGLRYIQVAIETASARLQKLIKKNIDIELVVKNIAKMRKAGIYITLAFMVGLPTETIEEIDLTFNLAKRASPDIPFISVATPFSNTPMWNLLDEAQKVQAHGVDHLDAQLGWQGSKFSALTGKELFDRVARFSAPYLLNRKNWHIIYNNLLFDGLPITVARMASYLAPQEARNRLLYKYKSPYYGSWCSET